MARKKKTLDDVVPAEQRKLVTKRRQPDWITPMLATLTESYFSDPAWIFEPKLDGVRCLAIKKDKKVTLLSRNKLSLNGRYPTIAEAMGELPFDDVILDGEAAVVSQGVTRFQSLQRHLLQGSSAGSLALFAFDIPYLEGRDLRKLPVVTRKAILENLISPSKHISVVKHIVGDGEELLEQACAKGWEGIIAKRADAPYTPGRSKNWLKFKCVAEQELVIGGFTDPQGSRVGLGALLLGYYEDGEFLYAGKVGTGFNARLLRELTARLQAIEQTESPFFGKPPLRKGAHWVKPKLVAQIGFSEWTRDGRLRHPRFLGLRDDKAAEDVVREKPG